MHIYKYNYSFKLHISNKKMSIRKIMFFILFVAFVIFVLIILIKVGYIELTMPFLTLLTIIIVLFKKDLI